MSQTGEGIPEKAIELNPETPAAVSGGGRITVGGGTVKLFGSLAHDEARQTVEERIRGTGSHAVVPEIDVEGSEGDERHEDTMMAAAAGEAILHHIDVFDDTVSLRVERGWVELEGEVEDYQVREAVDHVLRDLCGVQGITNSLNVRSEVSVEQLKSEVSQALDRVAGPAGVV